MWFAHEIKTDSANFESEIPPVRWKRSKDKWNAAFLYNKNARGGLYGNANIAGEAARGYHIDCTFVRDNTDALKYGSTNETKKKEYDELDMIFFKFMVSETSGFTNNL
jgi:hypothetical protein